MVAFLLMLQIAGSGGFVPGSGGLNSWQKNTPVISSATASPSATTIVLQWTTDLASDSRGNCGGKVAVDDGVQAGVTSHQLIVAGLTASTGYSCTVQSGNTTSIVGTTTNAAATSTPITSVTLGTATDYNATSPPFAMNGDTFYNFVSNDGVTYLTTDDTMGYNGGAVTSAMMLAKFTSLSPLTATNVNRLSAYGPCCTPQGPEQLSPKNNGLLSMGGNLYMTIANQLQGQPIAFRQYYGSIIMSPDHGASWNNMQAPTTFTTTGTVLSPYRISLWPKTTPTNFGSATFVVYGADDGTLGYLVANNRFDNADAYIYGVSNNVGGALGTWNNGDSYYLWRVPRSKMITLHASDYQCFTSGNGLLDSQWSYDFSTCGPILTNVGKLSLASVQYIPALNRYLLMTYHYPSGAGTPSSSQWTVYESPKPWGTWTLVSTFTWGTNGDYNPVILQPDALAATFGTTTMRVMWTQNFTTPNYKMWYATMTVVH